MKKEIYKELKSAINNIADFFEPLNKKYCSDCLEAKFFNSKTRKEADNLGTICSKECGCCSNCKKNDGYFRDREDIKNFDKKLENYKKRYSFDNEYGFFDNNKKSCKIPRIRRSKICLRFSCKELQQKDISERANRIWWGKDKTFKRFEYLKKELNIIE